jgi:hypothetical protein
LLCFRITEERRLVEDLEPTLSKTTVLLEQLDSYTGCEKFIQNVRKLSKTIFPILHAERRGIRPESAPQSKRPQRRSKSDHSSQHLPMTPPDHQITPDP